MIIKGVVILLLVVVYNCHADGHVDDNSCEKRCSQKDVDESYPCQCNKQCREHGDCCEDYGLACLVKPWNEYGYDELQKALRNQEKNINLAKNVIVFIGDGLDLATTTASRIFKGQQNGNSGEEEKLTYEIFPHIALSKTYNTDQQTADSAGAATAMFAGVKTKHSTLGVDDRVEFNVCETTEEAMIDSVLVSAQENSKSTGIVTTSRITHATPAALYAHSANRNWEHEANDGCQDIASQMLTNAGHVNVFLGGGRDRFIPNTTVDPEYDDSFGRRTDGRNLLDEWNAMHEGDSHQFVWNKADMEATNGLFEPSHMQYSYDRDQEKEPSLSEMTVKALEILQKNDNGFFLMVEGARIDHAHHQGLGQRALLETIAFDDAISAALDMVNTKETLIIVTSDHAHGLSMIGYADRGNPILGLSDDVSATDGLPVSTLSYTGGDGAKEELEHIQETGRRRNLTNEQLSDPDFLQPAIFPTTTVSHGGEDVPIYAIGPMSHMFHSTHEQSYIAHVIRHAACMGEYKDKCSRFPERKDKLRKQPSAK